MVVPSVIETRTRIRTISLESALTQKDLAAAADRLRSWASVRGVEAAGPPLVCATGSAARVHLPITSQVMPHPDTGIALDFVEGGRVERWLRMPFASFQEIAMRLRPGEAMEFHSAGGRFNHGEIVALPGVLHGKISEPVRNGTGGAVRVITVARQSGTGGERVAELVADQLGYRLADAEVMRKAAEAAGVSPRSLEEASRHKGFFRRALESFARSGPAQADLWVPPMHVRQSPMYSSIEYRTFVEDAIRAFAAEGSVVIVGHGAQLVLSDDPGALRVLIGGSDLMRARRASISTGMPIEEALRTVHKADEERQAYFREFYSQGWLDPASYDLMINTDRLSPDAAAGLIVSVATAARDDCPPGSAFPNSSPALAGSRN